MAAQTGAQARAGVIGLAQLNVHPGVDGTGQAKQHGPEMYAFAYFGLAVAFLLFVHFASRR